MEGKLFITKKLAVLTMIVLAGAVYAKGASNIQRGGLGFLFPDHNSFVNPGQFATAHGSALQLGYEQQSSTGGAKSAFPSFVYGNGNFGFGVAAARTGTSLTSSGSYSDTITPGLGFSLMKERMTVGASYTRSITTGAVGDGTIGATVTFQGARRMGASVGVGYNRTLGTNASSAVVGFGYGFQSSNALEFNLTLNDLNTVGDWTGAGYFNLAKDWFYMGAGYSYTKLTQVSAGQARLGFVLGKVDLSGLISAPFTSGGTMTFGGTLRAAF